MLEIKEGAPFELSSLTDKAEYGSISDAGRAYGITYQAMVDDRFDVLGQIPQYMGWAWDHFLNKLVIDKIYGSSGAGPTLNEDSTAAFATSRGNLVASGGGVPTIDRIAAGRKFLRNVTAPASDASQTPRRLSLKPKILLAPTSLETTVEQLLRSPADTASSNEAKTNVFSNLTPAVDSYLDQLDSSAWYLFADPSVMPCLFMLALDGQVTPTVEIEQSRVNEPLGMFFRLSGAVGPLFGEWRGAYRNSGTA
jgi:hypothetical protein